MTVPYEKHVNKGNRNVREQRDMKKHQQIKTMHCTFEDKSTKVVHEPTQLLTVPIRKSPKEQKKKVYNKGPAALHFTAHNNKQINNCE
jgi:hypothetical protein